MSELNNGGIKPEYSVGSKAARGMKIELTARKILFGPEDDFKKGFNQAMDWAMSLIDRYKCGEGLFQNEETKPSTNVNDYLH